MNYTFENKLEENQMHMHVSIRKRKQYDEDLETVKWGDVEKIVSEFYEPPKNYVLGKCLNELQNLHSDYRCETTWIFELKEGQVLKFVSAAETLPLEEEKRFISASETVKKTVPKRKKPRAASRKKTVKK